MQAFIEGRAAPFAVGRLIRESTPSDRYSVVARNFSQCGKSEQSMNWLREALEAQRDPNPRPINLNISPLAVAIRNVYSR